MQGGSPDGAFALALLCGVFFVAVIGLGVLSLILRFSVVLANKFLGGSPPEDFYDDWSGSRTGRREGPTLAPVPGLMKGVGIILVATVVNAVVSVAAAVAMGADLRRGAVPAGADAGLFLAAQLMSLVSSFLIWVCTLSSMLPTSFGRAALITILMTVIMFVIVFGVGLGAAILTGALIMPR